MEYPLEMEWNIPYQENTPNKWNIPIQKFFPFVLTVVIFCLFCSLFAVHNLTA
jgi:hypothetical protein